MRQRAGTFLLLVTTVAAIAAALLWRQSAAPPMRVRQIGLPWGSNRLQAQTSLLNAGLGMGGPPADARMVTTAATAAGRVTVCVHGIRPMDRMYGQGPPPLFMPLGPLILRLEVLGAGAGVDIEASSLRVQDNTGSLVRLANIPAASFPLEGVTIFQEYLEAPAPNARYLTRIEGTLRVPDGASVQRIPFRIVDVPLPNTPRLFGRCVPRELPASAARGLGAGLLVIPGWEAQQLMRKTTPVALPEGFVPEYLLLGEGMPARIGVPTPASAQKLDLQAASGLAGSIRVRLACGASLWSGTVWSSERFLVVLPGGTGPRTALVMQIGHDWSTPMEPPDVPSPFPSAEGTPGGAIHSSVLVAGRSFGRGYLQVELWQKQGDRWDGPRSLRVPVREDGSFVVPNLAPGEYRMARSGGSLVPVPPRRDVAWPLDAYMHERFLADRGAWTGEQVASIQVRPGQQVEVAPMRWLPSASGAVAAGHPAPQSPLQ